MNIIYYTDKKGKERIGIEIKTYLKNGKRYYKVLHKGKDFEFEEIVKIEKKQIIKIVGGE